MATIHFSEHQTKALSLFTSGSNMCLTGPGGTGKSLLINEMYQRGVKMGKTICVTAMTGCAAYLLFETKARTLHSWSGVYRYNEREVTPSLIASYVKLIHKKRKQSMERWLSTDCLIIDEISMMSSQLFTLLDGIGRELRSHGFNNPHLKSLPFGGIQVILVGDFLQIPPVIKREDIHSKIPIFECKSWRSIIRKRSQVIVLRRNFRALLDNNWANMLLRIRQGKCDSECKRALESRLLSNPHIEKEMKCSKVKPTVLVSTHLQVDAMNIANLIKCPEKSERFFDARAVQLDIETKEEKELSLIELSPNEKDAWKETIDQSLIPEQLVLRQGAQVMCLSNIEIEKGLVNGARGVVTRYDTQSGYPVILWKSTGTERICKPVLLPTRHPLIFVKQIPLCQAWAITIHKSQGQTLDCVEVDIGKSVFVPGQAYVALSRVRSLSSLYIRNFSPHSVYADPFAKRFCDAIGDV